MVEPGSNLKEQVAQVTVMSVKDIRPAAEALRDIAWKRASFRVAVADNIASKTPLMDEDGAVLASEVFGWNAPDERWWADSRLALSSPLPRACRYESEPFWVNADGFRTRQPNRYLEAIDLSNFEKRALCRSAVHSLASAARCG